MELFSAIDVGSNAIRMTVGRLNTEGRLETVENLRVPVRLGQDAFGTGRFSEQTIQMVVDAFLHFRATAQTFQVTKTRVVATSAVREAENSDILIDRVARQTGYAIDVIQGDEEAMLIHLAVKGAVDLSGKRSAIIDIGGGSVEVTLSDGENVVDTESYAMGTVRLLRHLSRNGGERFPFDALVREYAERAKRRIDRELGGRKVSLCLGTGGNVEEMGRLRKRFLKRDSENVITLPEIKTLIDRLGRMSVEERITRLGLRPDRADVILPAAVVLYTFAKGTGAKEVRIPGVGLKDGVLLELASHAKGRRLPLHEQVMASALRMAQKYRCDELHGRLTARMAATLFSQTLPLHNLHERELLLLETAALLHDVGHFINNADHEKHGHYLLRHHPILGLTPQDQEIVANVVRYHRKGTPSGQNLSFLSQQDRMTVTKLCALLRLADALDPSYTGRVTDVEIKHRGKKWRLKPIGTGELMLERWTLEKKKQLFQEVFGVSLEIEGGTP